jgi:hypothetical protein
MKNQLNGRIGEDIKTLVTALDGYPVGSGSAGWTVLVHGAYRQGNIWFLQLSSAAHPGADLVVRAPAAATGQHVLAAIRQWTPPSSPSMTLVTVPSRES